MPGFRTLTPTPPDPNIRLQERLADLERQLADLQRGFATIDPVHLVGTSGEPAFQNGWANYGSPYTNAGFWIDLSGTVHLQGLVKNGPVNSVVFTLPVGYRPAAYVLLVTTTNAALGRADILPNGNVMATTSQSAWFALDGLTFRAA